jgi:hypothetical protein
LYLVKSIKKYNVKGIRDNEEKKKNKIRNPYHEVLRELYKPKQVPDKKKKQDKEICRKKIDVYTQ